MQTSSRRSRRRSDAASRWWPLRCVTNPSPTHSSAPSCSSHRREGVWEGNRVGRDLLNRTSFTVILFNHCFTVSEDLLFFCQSAANPRNFKIFTMSQGTFSHKRSQTDLNLGAKFSSMEVPPATTTLFTRSCAFPQFTSLIKIDQSQTKTYLKHPTLKLIKTLETVKQNYQTLNLAMSSKLKTETWTGLRTFTVFLNKSLMIPWRNSRPPPLFFVAPVESRGPRCSLHPSKSSALRPLNQQKVVETQVELPKKVNC